MIDHNPRHWYILWAIEVVKMNIGEVSKQLKLTKKAITLYEQKGLIAPSKDDNGYRIYGKGEIMQLQQIKILRSLEFSINEISEILLNNNYQLFDEKLESLKVEEYDLQKKMQYFDLIKADFIDNTILDKIDDYPELFLNETKEEIDEKNQYVDFERIFLYILLISNYLTFVILDIKRMSSELLLIVLVPIWIACITLLKYPQSRTYFYYIYRKIKGE